MGSPDPFPRERFVALAGRMPRYARLAWRLGRDPGLSRARRVALFGGAAYLASPIDLVPGIIPLAGQLDDAAVALLAIRGALRSLPPDAAAAHLAATELSREGIDEDLATVRALAAWLARGAGRLAWRGARAAGRGALRGVRALSRAAARRGEPH